MRGQLVRLLRSLPVGEVEDHVDQLLLYIRAGMTHLAADIRITAVEILDWLLEASGIETVSCAGGWVKTLKCFLALLGWQNEDGSAKWSGVRASLGKAGSEDKSLVKILTVLATFLKVGLHTIPGGADEGLLGDFPRWHSQYHTLPRNSNCFAHLNLFGTLRDAESEMYEDREERQTVFHTIFEGSIERGLDSAKKEGGEVGRAAALVMKAITEGMDDFGAHS